MASALSVSFVCSCSSVSQALCNAQVFCLTETYSSFNEFNATRAESTAPRMPWARGSMVFFYFRKPKSFEFGQSKTEIRSKSLFSEKEKSIKMIIKIKILVEKSKLYDPCLEHTPSPTRGERPFVVIWRRRRDRTFVSRFRSTNQGAPFGWKSLISPTRPDTSLQ